jgi:hypothetical protein
MLRFVSENQPRAMSEARRGSTRCVQRPRAARTFAILPAKIGACLAQRDKSFSGQDRSGAIDRLRRASENATIARDERTIFRPKNGRTHAPAENIFSGARHGRRAIFDSAWDANSPRTP